MKTEYRTLLNANMDALCKGMNHAKVISRLAKSGLFRKYDLEKINHRDTTQDKNSQILDCLQERDFDGLSEFLRTLASIDHTHYKLAEELQPVKHRVAWFAPSPTHAASIVYALEEYAGAKFSRMQRDGALVIRRARIFPKEFDKEEHAGADMPVDVPELVRWSHKTEVCLVFPASPSPSNAWSALESFFAADELISNVDMLLLSITEEMQRGEGRTITEEMQRGEGRRVVLATEVVGSERLSSGVTEAELKSLETWLESSMKESHHDSENWMKREQNGVTDTLGVSFNVLHQLEATSDLHTTQDAVVMSDPVAYRFYELCEARCPGKRSLLCHSALCREQEGELATVSLGVELRAAVASSCILMEVCKHFYS